MRARRERGGKSGYSAKVTQALVNNDDWAASAPHAPTITSAYLTDLEEGEASRWMMVEWEYDPADVISGYKVTYGLPSGDGSQEELHGADASQCTTTDYWIANPSTGTYTVTVQAWNTRGYSEAATYRFRNGTVSTAPKEPQVSSSADVNGDHITRFGTTGGVNETYWYRVAAVNSKGAGAVTQYEAASPKIDTSATDAVSTAIEVLPATADAVTLEDKTAIQNARAAYDALTEQQKTFVTGGNVTKLANCETGLRNAQAVQDVKDLIAAVPAVGDINTATLATSCRGNARSWRPIARLPLSREALLSSRRAMPPRSRGGELSALREEEFWGLLRLL